MPWPKGWSIEKRNTYQREWYRKKHPPRGGDFGPNRKCRVCQHVMPRTTNYFFKNPRNKFGFSARCKGCTPASAEKSRQNVTRTERDKRLAAQTHCAICQAKMTNKYLDHCHTTGKIRGVLCNCCNSALGKFRDNVGLLRRAIAYLEHFRQT